MSRIPKQPPLPQKMSYPTKPRAITTLKEWERYITRIKKHFQKMERKSFDGLLSRIDLTEPLASRRTKAILNTIETVQKQYDDPDIHAWDPNYIGIRWIRLCMRGPTFEELEEEQHILVGAAIWILDQVANDRDNRETLFDLLPTDERVYADLIELNCWHPRYDFNLIMSVVYVLRYRNAANGDTEIPRALTDETTALRGFESSERKNQRQRQRTENAQKADNYHAPCSINRERFETLLGMIPQESIDAAVERLKAMFWPWVTDYFQTILPYGRKIMEIDLRIENIVQEYNHTVDLIRAEADTLVNLKRGQSSRRKNGVNAGKKVPQVLHPSINISGALPTPDSLMQGVMTAGSKNTSLNWEIGEALQKDPMEIHFEQIEKYYDQLGSLIKKYNDLISNYDKRQASEYQEINDFITTGGQRPILNSAECVSQESPVQYRCIANPYELCFALLYLIETGDDMVWTYGPCIGLMYAVCDNLPWGLREFDMNEDPIWEDFTIHEFPAQKPANIPDWNERRFQVKGNTPRNLAQLLFECTGCLLPQDMHLYDGFMKSLRKCGVRAKETPALLTAMTTLATSKMQIPAYNLKNWGDGTTGETDNAGRDESADTDKEKELLTQQIKQLRSALHDAERRERDVRKELEKEREVADREHRELADLRDYVFNQESDVDSENDSTGRQENALALPYEVQRTTIVFGGHESWVAPIKQMLKGNIRFIDRGYTFDTAIIRGAEVLWIQPNAIPHKMYYRIIDQARRLKKPVRYFANASAALCAQQVAEGERKLI